ncbi:hypothetical protein [Falsibacillus pallidus]|uniref:Lipoprotein n=1 Tax=Falsibacillus pallidus TaxID=493781 RepID=A0A370GEE4_9BACI|nr:hypothetical protein [Falsibacillus pallidus]RDI42178.1 hypothetical protein DFR59_10517 [Falsibacillus pallidus]
MLNQKLKMNDEVRKNTIILIFTSCLLLLAACSKGHVKMVLSKQDSALSYHEKKKNISKADYQFIESITHPWDQTQENRNLKTKPFYKFYFKSKENDYAKIAGYSVWILEGNTVEIGQSGTTAYKTLTKEDSMHLLDILE